MKTKSLFPETETRGIHTVVKKTVAHATLGPDKVKAMVESGHLEPMDYYAGYWVRK